MKKLLRPVCYALVLVISTGLIAYGWILLRLEKAEKTLQMGENEKAAQIYTDLESYFHKVPWLPQLLREEYKALSFGHVSILYAQNQNDEALKMLEQLPAFAPFLPETGEYSFWMGNLLFRQAVQTKDPESSVNALKAALSEYQRGLAAQPDDWDLKYNYELVRYIFSQRDRDKKKEEQKVKSIIEKMRPTDPSRQEVAPEKRG